MKTLLILIGHELVWGSAGRQPSTPRTSTDCSARAQIYDFHHYVALTGICALIHTAEERQEELSECDGETFVDGMQGDKARTSCGITPGSNTEPATALLVELLERNDNFRRSWDLDRKSVSLSEHNLSLASVAAGALAC